MADRYVTIADAPAYCINKEGLVWSRARKAPLRSWLNKSGTESVSLWVNGRYITRTIPKLVQLAFSDETPEGFKPVNLDGLDGYVINKSGDIFSLKHRKLRVHQKWRGWHKVMLWNRSLDKNSSYSVHKLVMLTFGPSQPEWCDQINHIDGNKSNNHVSNLEWCNALHNTRHAQALGLRKPRKDDDYVCTN